MVRSYWLTSNKYDSLCTWDDTDLVTEVGLDFVGFPPDVDVAPGVKLVALYTTVAGYVANGGAFMFFDVWHQTDANDDYLAQVVDLPKVIPDCQSLETFIRRGKVLRERVATSADERWEQLTKEFEAMEPTYTKAVASFIRQNKDQFVRKD